MDEADRLVKKRKEAIRLRDVPPARTLRMGFTLCDFARELSEATDRADV